MFERASVLATRLAEGHDNMPDAAAVRLGEVRGFTLRQASAFPETIKAFEDILERELHAAVPRKVGGVARASATLIIRAGPEQLWLIGRAGDGIESRIRSCLDSAMGVLTELSHSRARIFIEGPKASAVLMKGIALDFDPGVFQPDTAAFTGVHHMPLLIHRIDEGRYEFYVMRTFALCVWDWLTDAALEFGYVVAKRPEAT